VLDARTLRYPEYRGNGSMVSLGNILDNPHIGMVLLDFDQERIGLHINGTPGSSRPASATVCGRG
jgi:uncharacterized protein